MPRKTNKSHTTDLLNPNLDALEDSHDASSLEALTSRRSRQAEKNAAALHSAADAMSSENASTTVVGVQEEPLDTGSAAGLEEEAASEGAFNPETGEINWDCPCLGGMAHGPCGPEFREAFSCFVYSTEEPKGMDCIDKFQNMQQCFQKYPEIYKGELEDDEELDAGLEAERQELVNEIAERKAEEAGRQRRLLEEPEPAPRPSKKPAPKAESQPTAPQKAPKASDDQATPSHLQSDKPPQPEGKVTVNGDATLSPERENISEGQKSTLGKQSKPSSAEDQTFIPEPDIVPRAAHDAKKSS